MWTQVVKEREWWYVLTCSIPSYAFYTISTSYAGWLCFQNKKGENAFMI